MPKDSPYLNTAQTAFYMRISQKTLKNMRKTGTGPPFRRHGRGVLYHIGEVDAWSKATASNGKTNGHIRQLEFDFMLPLNGRDRDHDHDH